MCRAYYFDVRIDQEKRDDLSVTGFCRIGELERANAVLQYIGECQQTAFSSFDTSKFLHTGTLLFASKYIREPVVLVLFVGYISCFLWVNLMSERKSRLGNVLA